MIILASLLSCSYVAAKPAYVCGMAEGFSPYQFSENGEPRGLDYAAFQIMAAAMDVPIKVWVGDWDNIVAKLRFGKLDCAIGMEWDQTRGKYFDFTTPFYQRRSAVFVLADNTHIQSVMDLDKQAVVGDRHSYFDRYLKDHHINVRSKQTESKEESILLLKQQQYQAMIAPLQVGKYLSAKHQIPLRVLSLSPAGTPVSMVVQKGNRALLQKMEAALNKVKEDIDIIYAH